MNKLAESDPDKRWLYDIINASEDSKKLNALGAESRVNGKQLPLDFTEPTIPYNDTRKLLKLISKDSKKYQEFGTDDRRALAKLRNTLQTDLDKSIENFSPATSKALNDYNARYTRFKDFENKYYKPLVLEKIGGKLYRRSANNFYDDVYRDLKNEGTYANEVLNTLGDKDRKVFSESLITSIGSDAQHEFKPSTLATNFKKLKPEAQEVILSTLEPAARHRFKNTIEAIDAMKETADLANKSRTGSFNLVKDIVSGGGKVLGGLAGLATFPWATVTGVLGLNLASKQLLANQKFVKWISDASKIKSQPEYIKHIGALDAIARSTPAIAKDIREYAENVERKAEQKNSSPSKGYNTLSDAELIELDNKYNELKFKPEPTRATPELINKISQIESNNNPLAKAKGSTASGLYQFTNGTWKDAVNRYGDELGITLADKNNPIAQKAVTERMIEDNGRELTRFLGREAEETELYLTHFLGLEGAKKLLQSDGRQFAARVLPAAAKSNRGVFFRNGKPLTVTELYQTIDRKLKSA